MKKIKLSSIITFVIALLLYFIPSFIFKMDKEFYYSLNGPHLPSWVFATMWTIIYITMSFFVTYYIDRLKTDKNKDIKRLLIFVGINYILQLLYIPLFSIFKDLFLSYIDCLLVFITILLISLESLVINKKITLLTIPYLIWSIVASILSIMLYLLN